MEAPTDPPWEGSPQGPSQDATDEDWDVFVFGNEAREPSAPCEASVSGEASGAF
jgi:hypothetical protein